MSTSATFIDPVCGMTLSEAESPAHRVHGDATWRFCSVECALRFDADAEAYIAVSRLDLPGWGLTPHPPSVVERFRQADQLRS